jgi:hypothetical protein
MRIAMPNPLSVSAPAAPLPARAGDGGSMGPQYGTQQFAKWDAGDVGPRDLVDALKTGSLWRISVFGNVYVSIYYGTSHNRAIEQLQAPVVLTLPGQVVVKAWPRDNEGAECVVTLTQATAGGLSHARKYVDAGAGPAVDLDAGACRFVALEASTLTISGQAVTVPALSTVPLVSGSSLDTGSGFQEFEA